MDHYHKFSSAQIERLRRDAKAKARNGGIALHAALDETANAWGFSNWSLLMKAANDATDAPPQPPTAGLKTALGIFAKETALPSWGEALLRTLLTASKGSERGLVRVRSLARALPFDQGAGRFYFKVDGQPADIDEAVFDHLAVLVGTSRKLGDGQMHFSYQALSRFEVNRARGVVSFQFESLLFEDLEALARQHAVAVY